jgi:predicted lipoprotein with Yx(FWY)xxD motif
MAPPVEPILSICAYSLVRSVAFNTCHDSDHEVYTHMKRLFLLALAPAAAAIVIAGCGGGGDGNAQPTNGSAAGTGAGAKVALRKLKVGTALVDGQGRTLYLFEADKGTRSTCNGACASLWPPDTTSAKPVAGPGVDPAKLGTTKRSDGKLEVTYNGHPLYRYAADTKPGDATGQGLDQFGAEWYVLAASGSKIDRE